MDKEKDIDYILETELSPDRYCYIHNYIIELQQENKQLKEDLVNWLDRPPSNDDLDLIGFITTRLENFYKLEQEVNFYKDLSNTANNELNLLQDKLIDLEQENKQLKEKIDILLEDNNQLEEIRIKAIEEIKEHSEMTDLQICGIENVLAFRGSATKLLEILGDKENE